MSVLSIPIKGVEHESMQPSRTYKLDFERGKILLRGSSDGKDAVFQAIKKALLTPRFRCMIYDNQYGSELKQVIIAGNATREFAETEIPRMVQDAVLVDDRVFSVVDFSISFETENVYISCTAETAFGHIQINECFGYTEEYKTIQREVK